MDVKNNQIRLLNLACGSKVSSKGNWTNVDFSSPVSNVLEMDILNGLSFPNDSFDVVYTAQFIEHLTVNQAVEVLKEINRVLKPGGIVRIVTPDLAELAQSYLKSLDIVKQDDSSFNINKYDWIRLEIFDQIVRELSGGEQRIFIEQCDEPMRDYLTKRIGYTFTSFSNNKTIVRNDFKISTVIGKLKKVPAYLLRSISRLFATDTQKIGRFRQSGEVHRFLHDIYSLSLVLSKAGFSSVNQVDPYISAIDSWQTYELDVIDGVVDGPLCLYVEAIKS
jgi:predicted SAM-dependent methyltransferase